MISNSLAVFATEIDIKLYVCMYVCMYLCVLTKTFSSEITITTFGIKYHSIWDFEQFDGH